MKKNLLQAIFGYFLTILLFLIFYTNGNLKAQTPGTPAYLPDFTFYKLDGSVFNKQQLARGPHSIFILFDCGCEHCQREMVNIGEHYGDFKNVVFYLVTMDRKQEIDKFMGSFGRYLNGKPNVVLLQDRNAEFIPKFKPLKYPGIFVYASDGKNLFSNSGTTPLKDILTALNKG